MIPIILVSPRGDHETVQALSAYCVSHTARLTLSIAGFNLIDIGGSSPCTYSTGMTVPTLTNERVTVSTVMKNM